MTIDEIIEYVLETPFNTNKAILTAMLEELQNGSSDDPSDPDVPKDIIYEGGVI